MVGKAEPVGGRLVSTYGVPSLEAAAPYVSELLALLVEVSIAGDTELDLAVRARRLLEVIEDDERSGRAHDAKARALAEVDRRKAEETAATLRLERAIGAARDAGATYGELDALLVGGRP